MIDEEDTREYRWETGYEKTWETTHGDDGYLEASVADIIQRAKRKRHALKKSCQKLGLMRHIFLVIDCSECMSCQDLKPTRLIYTLKLLEIFLEEFFDQNPISQVGIIIMHNKRAEKISDLAGNFTNHAKLLRNLNQTTLIGEPSLQNGLELALSSLKMLPSHISREVLIIMASLTTCDPSDINKTIECLKQEKVRCSVIGLAAEVHVCRQLANITGGIYNVILDDNHFSELLLQQVEPPAAVACMESSLIKMGFPHQINSGGSDELLTMCMRHVDDTDDGSKLTTGGYYCPQCLSKYCDLPVECRACNLTLVSAPHLARSYHHLFPPTNYKEINYEKQTTMCFACQKPFEEHDKQVYECPSCKNIFCVDCDIFVHDTLHTCPGCATTLPTRQLTNDH